MDLAASLGGGQIDVGDPDEGAGADEFLYGGLAIPLAPPVTRAWRPASRNAVSGWFSVLMRSLAVREAPHIPSITGMPGLCQEEEDGMRARL